MAVLVGASLMPPLVSQAAVLLLLALLPPDLVLNLLVLLAPKPLIHPSWTPDVHSENVWFANQCSGFVAYRTKNMVIGATTCKQTISAGCECFHIQKKSSPDIDQVKTDWTPSQLICNWLDLISVCCLHLFFLPSDLNVDLPPPLQLLPPPLPAPHPDRHNCHSCHIKLRQRWSPPAAPPPLSTFVWK